MSIGRWLCRKAMVLLCCMGGLSAAAACVDDVPWQPVAPGVWAWSPAEEAAILSLIHI